MSWYTVGEIIVWLLIAAVLGGVLGWLLRGVLRPRVVEVERRARPAAVAAPEAEPTPEPQHAWAPEPEPEPESEPEPEPHHLWAPEPKPIPLVEPPVTTGTIVTDVDTPQPKRAPSRKPMPTSRTPSRSSPRPEPEPPMDARSRVIAIAKRTAGRGAVPKDDLVLVHGIGPKIARLLADMDITSFRQIARLSDADVEDITAALEAFPGRIERDDWMGSARELHRETYGDDPLE